MTAVGVETMRSWLREDWPHRWWLEVGGTTYRLYDTRGRYHRRQLAAIWATVLRWLGLDVCRVRTHRLGQQPPWHAAWSVLRPATDDEARAALEAAS